MFKNYLKTAWRNLIKDKMHSFINIAGLSIGMAVAMLIGLWIYDEVSFNKNFDNYSRIAQVMQNTGFNGSITTNQVLPYAMGDELRRNYGSDFKAISMATWTYDHILAYGENKIAKSGNYMEPQIIDMLSLKMIEGTRSALNDNHSIILSSSAARVLFGNTDPLNKTLKIDNQLDVKVSGVYKDLPYNSDFRDLTFIGAWQLFIDNTSWVQKFTYPWSNNSFQVFVQLADNADIQKVSAKIKDAKLKRVSSDDASSKPQLFLRPMSKWHLYSEFKNGVNAGGRIAFVWMFGIIGFFVLLLACINFINLSTARAEKRAKEVGIRKAIGSLKRQLIQQFLSESFLVVILAFMLSLLLVTLSLPWFNELADKKISIPFLNPFFWLINLAFIIITALLAGAYPSFYLSAFKPVKVLKGTIRLGRFASLPRKALVVLQFTVSVILIIGTIVVYKQIQFAQDRPVGYDRAGLITIPKNDPNYDGKLDLLRNELLNTGMVEGMELSSSSMTEIGNNSSDFDWIGKQPREYSFAMTKVSYGFGKMVGWQFIAGRDFSKAFATDTNKIIINETAAKDMSFKNPVGKFVKTAGDTKTLQIIGVIKDMIMGSPYEPEKRAIFFLDAKYQAASQIEIKIKPAVSANAALPKIEAVFRNIVPSAIFDYKFVDEEYAKKFGQEQRIGKLSTFFAVLAIFISCLGLFGLASFVAEQRTKEIGVRKVVGASVFNIWNLLSKEFIGLVIISLLIASPIAYFCMNNWVQKYTYHTNISWWIFFVAGCGTLIITLLTVSYQAIKAAIANPVKSLRTE